MKQAGRRISLQLIAGIVFLSLLCPTFVFAQKDDKEKAKQEKKEAKQNEKDEKRIEKQVRRYDEALRKALDKYGKDIEFKEDVDYEYRRLQRDHARLAFDYNTLDRDDEVMTNAGDKLPKNNDTLYDNLLAQDYVNRVGQSLVPASSDKRYGFKITVSPMPEARSLSTGTVYISTGLISLVDNEAQLAYILAHEIAHIERDHWKQDVLVAKQIEEETRSQEKKAGIIGAVAGGVLGGIGKSASDALTGAVIGAALAKSFAKMIDNRAFEWSLAQEDESDRLAMEYMLNRNYDVREAQNFYDTLKLAAIDDPRIELDRFADRERTEERHRMIKGWIASADSSRIAKTTIGATNLRGKSLGIDRNTAVVVRRIERNQTNMADDIKMKVQSGDLMAGDGEFESILATLKRDNGIVAFYYDMYKLSERNLSQALAIRSDDPLGYFFYGKVLKLTARKPGEKEKAMQLFAKAIELDARGTIPQSRLYYALTKMSGRTTNNVQEIVADLKQYVEHYQRMNAGSLPPNMNIIYDYMQEAGETNWLAMPTINVRAVTVANTSAPPPSTQTSPASTQNKTTTTKKQ
jgi:hypothetical protein